VTICGIDSQFEVNSFRLFERICSQAASLSCARLNRKRNVGYAFQVLVSVLWGVNHYVLRVADGELPLVEFVLVFSGLPRLFVVFNAAYRHVGFNHLRFLSMNVRDFKL
jgi:hypothetical protein